MDCIIEVASLIRSKIIVAIQFMVAEHLDHKIDLTRHGLIKRIEGDFVSDGLLF